MGVCIGDLGESQCWVGMYRVCAVKGTTADDPTLGLDRAAGVDGDLGAGVLFVHIEAVGRPLEEVADHVVDAGLSAAARVGADRCGADKAVIVLVHHGRIAEFTLDSPGPALAAAGVEGFGSWWFVAPGVDPAVGSAGRELPLDLKGQALASGLAKALRLEPRDAVDRVLLAPRLALVAEFAVDLLRALPIGFTARALGPDALAIGTLALAGFGALAEGGDRDLVAVETEARDLHLVGRPRHAEHRVFAWRADVELAATVENHALGAGFWLGRRRCFDLGLRLGLGLGDRVGGVVCLLFVGGFDQQDAEEDDRAEHEGGREAELPQVALGGGVWGRPREPRSGRGEAGRRAADDPLTAGFGDIEGAAGRQLVDHLERREVAERALGEHLGDRAARRKEGDDRSVILIRVGERRGGRCRLDHEVGVGQASEELLALIEAAHCLH